MSRIKYLKILTAVFAVISAFLVTSINPDFNNFILRTRFYSKYQNLDQALVKLSNFIPVPNQPVGENQTYTGINKGESGFEEMLNVITHQRKLESPNNLISFIVINNVGTRIEIGSLDATPRYLLRVFANGKYENVAVMYKEDLRSWVENEKQIDLQIVSIWFIVAAVLIDLFVDAAPTVLKIINDRVRENL